MTIIGISIKIIIIIIIINNPDQLNYLFCLSAIEISLCLVLPYNDVGRLQLSYESCNLCVLFIILTDIDNSLVKNDYSLPPSKEYY
jgi:hypothetical protein